METEIVKVRLSERSYDIFISRGEFKNALEKAKERVLDGDKIVFVSEENIWNKYVFVNEKELEGSLRVIVENGEKAKCFRNFETICSALAKAKVDRRGAIFAVGGGVVGDLAGFAASAYMRGIDFYQIPTTLLAMVDSSVGGKTGINIAEGKNLVGAFHQPRAVFIDTAFLDTLDARQFRAGMAEVIKYAMLADAEFFAKLESLKEPLSASHPNMGEVIAHCCRMKAEIVSADERETAKDGGRALLNLGHTFAHAIENSAGYGTYLHGEAVGLGLLLAARMSEKLGMLSKSDVERVENILHVYGLETRLRGAISSDRLLEASKRDKKVMSGHSRYVLLDSIGKAVVRSDIPEALVREIFDSAQI